MQQALSCTMGKPGQKAAGGCGAPWRRDIIIIKQGGGKIISGASMKDVPNILWLEEIRKEDIISVGGKGASLGEMASIGLPVPKAFVVTAQAFRRFLVETGLEKKLFASYQDLDVENNEALEKAAEGAKAMVLKAKMPAAIRDEIRKAYKKMSEGELIVAVRSSATAEDLPDASFAGQQETYLNIKGEAALLSSVQKCWASLYGARAIYYRAKQGFDDHTVNIAVVVQQLVHSEKAGVMFTSHPITGEPLTIIEGSWGLGEAVVSGSVSPDKYVFDQRTERSWMSSSPTRKSRSLPTVTTARSWWMYRKTVRMHRCLPERKWQSLRCTARSPRTTTGYRRTSSGVS